ncbi:MAG: YraN family protein [Pseudomonadota bacterium]
MSGAMAHQAGLAAEEAVERHYRRQGAKPLHRRWRRRTGEIDLVLCDPDDTLVFVEVKARRHHADAAAAITPRARQRISDTILGYLAETGRDLGTEIRFDVALVDRMGAIDCIENALA